jgi:hypothetical protein
MFSHVFFFSFRSSVDSIGTDKLDTALKQLKNLKSFLASHVNTMDRLSVELVMLISMACQVSETYTLDDHLLLTYATFFE